MDSRKFAPATLRNREPILEVLARYVPARARVLEIASGTGEHATFFAERLLVDDWQPSDRDLEARASIEAWRRHTNAARVRAPIALDVLDRPWGPWSRGAFDVIVNVNMVHIAPWEACSALFLGASELLEDGAIVFLYGPFKRGGVHTAPSNEAFDARLRAENPDWGVRDLEAVVDAATRQGFGLVEDVPMPANNLSLVFRRRAGASPSS